MSPPPQDKDKASPQEATETEAEVTLSKKTAAIKMLDEVKRVLKGSGRFICISLLQPHVAQSLFSYFHKEGWMIRVCRCHTAEEQNAKNSNDRATFPVYMCVFTKMKLPGAAVSKTCKLLVNLNPISW